MKFILKSGHRDWYQSEIGYAIGYAFIKEKLLDEKQLCSYLYNVIERNALPDSLKELNGCFAAVIKYQNDYYLIVDKIRSYPILFGKIGDGWLVSNNAEKIISDNEISKELDSQSTYEFLAAGYLSGEKTLLEKVKQVIAGTYVRLVNDSRVIVEYHNHMSDKIVRGEDEIVQDAEGVLDRAFERMFESIGGSQIVLPLSGGYDSRLIACMCKRYKRQNVICYSYGRRDSFEVEVSKNVAMQLGFEWFFVEYSSELFDSLQNDSDFTHYLDCAHNLNALPHFQDYFAVKELRERGVFEPGAVFIPGHSGDLLGGSKLPIEVYTNELSPTLENLAKLIYEHFFDLNKEKYNDQDKCIGMIVDQLKDCSVDTIERVLNIYEPYWFVKGKIANFLVNSMRVYEHFGFDWRLPLWDDEYAAFWYAVEWKKKINSELYNRFMFDTYFIPLQVAYKKKNMIKQLVPPMLKKFAPMFIVNFLRCFYMRLHTQKYDFNAQSRMSLLFKEMNRMKDNYHINDAYDTNSIAVIYILNQITGILQNEQRK